MHKISIETSIEQAEYKTNADSNPLMYSRARATIKADDTVLVRAVDEVSWADLFAATDFGGEVFVQTCSCGVPECNGFFEPVEIEITDTTVSWVYPNAKSYANLAGKTFCFDRLEYILAMADLENWFCTENKAGAHVYFPDELNYDSDTTELEVLNFESHLFRAKHEASKEARVRFIVDSKLGRVKRKNLVAVASAQDLEDKTASIKISDLFYSFKFDNDYKSLKSSVDDWSAWLSYFTLEHLLSNKRLVIELMRELSYSLAHKVPRYFESEDAFITALLTSDIRVFIDDKDTL